MRRHVNLVNPALLPPKPFFQFNSMAMALGVLLLGLLLISWFISSRVSVYEKIVAAQHGKLESAQEELRRLKEQTPQRKSDPAVAARFEALQAQQVLLERIDQTLQGGQPQGATPVGSDYLVALGSQPLPGVWLTGIRISADGISLQGSAQDASAVPATLGLLDKMSAFKGQHFAVLEVTPTEASATAGTARTTRVLNFSLASTSAREAR